MKEGVMEGLSVAVGIERRKERRVEAGRRMGGDAGCGIIDGEVVEMLLWKGDAMVLKLGVDISVGLGLSIRS